MGCGDTTLLGLSLLHILPGGALTTLLQTCLLKDVCITYNHEDSGRIWLYLDQWEKLALVQKHRDTVSWNRHVLKLFQMIWGPQTQDSCNTLHCRCKCCLIDLCLHLQFNSIYQHICFVHISLCIYYCISVVQLELRDGDTSISFYCSGFFQLSWVFMFPSKSDHGSLKICEDFVLEF